MTKCDPLKIKGNKMMKHNDSREDVIWNYHPMGWLKANFYGSTKGNPERAGCGGVLRDHNRRVVDVVAFPIVHLMIHREEAIASLYTIRMVVETSYHKLWLEGDSLNIINMLNNRNMVTWNIQVSILEIKISDQ